MENQFSLFDLLLIIGITQGLVTSLLLLTSKKNSRSNPFLALALIAFCFLSTKPLLHTLHLWDMSVFRYFPNGVEVLLAPLIYFYVVSMMDSTFKFERKHLLHFIPFAISQSYAFVVYFLAFSIENFGQKDILANSLMFSEVKKTEDYLSLLSIMIYLLLGYRKLKDYRKWLDESTSDSTFPDFNWLKNIFILSSILGCFLLTNYTLDLAFSLREKTSLHWQLVQVFIAVLIYYFGFVGYKQPHYEKVIVKNPNTETGKIKLSKEKQESIVKAIDKAFQEDKVYLNPTINIQQLSKILGIPQRHVSLVINKHYNQKFRDLINKYRIEEVKLKLSDPSLEHLSILGVALECGFNSEASFYRIFKKNTGLSPKEYLSLEKKERT